MKQYYERMKEVRIDRDMLQKDVAEILEIKRGVYSRYYKVVNEMPKHHLKKFCEHFKVSADYILDIKF